MSRTPPRSRSTRPAASADSRELERRHDAAIHLAAGLGPPDALTAQALKLVDLRALATERRDFYRRGAKPRPWAIDQMSPPIEPGPKVWRWLPR